MSQKELLELFKEEDKKYKHHQKQEVKKVDNLYSDFCEKVFDTHNVEDETEKKIGPFTVKYKKTTAEIARDYSLKNIVEWNNKLDKGWKLTQIAGEASNLDCKVRGSFPEKFEMLFGECTHNDEEIIHEPNKDVLKVVRSYLNALDRGADVYISMGPFVCLYPKECQETNDSFEVHSLLIADMINAQKKRGLKGVIDNFENDDIHSFNFHVSRFNIPGHMRLIESPFNDYFALHYEKPHSFKEAIRTDSSREWIEITSKENVSVNDIKRIKQDFGLVKHACSRFSDYLSNEKQWIHKGIQYIGKTPQQIQEMNELENYFSYRLKRFSS
ncbi:hypothetical protein GF336_04815 [Candidatus Woesearchaeota archaeon]|nr:hypothetical protein [Candidatus Woesearchaeota archaeon]